MPLFLLLPECCSLQASRPGAFRRATVADRFSFLTIPAREAHRFPGFFVMRRIAAALLSRSTGRRVLLVGGGPVAAVEAPAAAARRARTSWSSAPEVRPEIVAVGGGDRAPRVPAVRPRRRLAGRRRGDARGEPPGGRSRRGAAPLRQRGRRSGQRHRVFERRGPARRRDAGDFDERRMRRVWPACCAKRSMPCCRAILAQWMRVARDERINGGATACRWSSAGRCCCDALNQIYRRTSSPSGRAAHDDRRRG